MVVGHALDEKTQIGPLAKEEFASGIDKLVQSSIKDGAKCKVGAEKKDCYYMPTLLIDVTEDMSVFKEETFGPVFCVTKIKNIDDAIRHAVLNYNPALGRVQMSDFSVYENNMPQKIADFPLKQDKSWEFGLYGENFKASVIDITKSKAEISANADSGAFIKYTFDKDARWINNFEYTNSNGEITLIMNLGNYGSGYTGNSYFCRGGDLFDEEFIGPDFGVYDTRFANGGHERYGPWNYIVYYLEADIGSSGSGELVLRDHEGTEVLVETFSPGTNQHIMGTVTGSSGNWTLEISLSGNADVRARIAGAIQYTYSV